MLPEDVAAAIRQRSRETPAEHRAGEGSVLGGATDLEGVMWIELVTAIVATSVLRVMWIELVTAIVATSVLRLFRSVLTPQMASPMSRDMRPLRR
eukprot:s7198_g3.t1